MNKTLQFMLLPHRYRKIGYFGVFISAVALLVLAGFGLAEAEKEIAKAVLQFAVILSLLLMIISREKREDEFVKQLRERTLAQAAIALMVVAAIDPVLRLLLTEEGSSMQSTAITIEVMYLLIFHYSRHYLGEYE